ncbi:DUF4232 domain-containing protein [Streptomyces sp. NPDC048002]|uniref:DUF4232 domain-containing protein n=1 Tax=Streptomyces sp. NPDC048002 TaxID=3154344 RepID=UPI00340E27B9
MGTDIRRNRGNAGTPRGRRPYVAGAWALAAVLASAACETEPNDGSGSPDPDRPSAAGSAGPGATGPEDSATGTDGEGGDGTVTAACSAEDLTFGTTLKNEETEMPKHLLITVTNVGDKDCGIHHYPHVFLGDPAEARAPIGVYEDSDRGTGPVTLAPGDEAYSALLASGVPMDQYETDKVTLLLQGREPGSDGSEPIGVDLPREVPFDDGARVTYWTTESGYALDFIVST